MKKLGYLLICVLALLSFSQVEAQTRAEKKALKKELKKYKRMKAPEVKAAFERLDDMKGELQECNSEKSAMKSDLDAQIANLDDAEESLAEKEFLLNQLKAQIDSVDKIMESHGISTDAGPANPSGVYFRVQLTAMKYSRIPDKVANGLIIERAGGYDKLLKGFYRNIEDADYVSKYFRKLGIRDAWVACYQGNKRIARDQALSLL